MTNILIVDDQDDIRAGIRAMLLLDPGLVVVGDLSDGLQVPSFLRQHPVDLVLMDIRMPGSTGSRPPAGSAPSTHRRSSG